MSVYSYLVLALAPPRRKPVPVGIVLHDRARVWFLFGKEWPAASPGDRDLLEGLPEQLASIARQMHPSEFFSWCASSLANAFRASEVRSIEAQDAQAALRRAFDLHVPFPPGDQYEAATATA
jgi:hypothetical protein